VKTRLARLAFTAMLLGPLCAAQTNEPAEEWRPSSANLPGQPYPQVNSRGYVRFRVTAPQAQNVGVSGLGGNLATLTQGEDGVWTGVTSQPLDEGFHAVSYVSPLTAHEWQTWRRSLHEFAPLLFRD